MSRESVQTREAPKAIGPYAQAIKANGFVYTAGQIAIRPETGEMIDGERYTSVMLGIMLMCEMIRVSCRGLLICSLR